MKRLLFGAVMWLLAAAPSFAGVTCSLPFNLQNGTTADASQVMANYNALVTCLASAAAAGSNSDITALLGLTTPLSPSRGGSSTYLGGTSTNVSNAYTIATTVPTGYALSANYTVIFIANSANTGATTLTVAGTATTNFFRQTTTGPAPMIGGEIQTNQIVIAAYDGTQYECLNCVSQAFVPVGAVVDFTGPVGNIPAGWFLTDGRAVSRTTYSTLFAVETYTVSATMNGTTTVNITGASGFIQTGWYVGGTNLPCNTYVNTVNANSIVINSAATGSGTNNITVGPYQQGDCSTTFNIPDYLGKATFGVDGVAGNITSATCPNPASVGDKQFAPNLGCGAQTQTLTLAQLPTNITSSGALSGSAVPTGANIPGASSTITTYPGPSTGSLTTPTTSGSWITISSANLVLSGTASVTSNNTSGNAHPILSPAALVYKIIKY